ncbi:acyltransferase family protein [Rhodococcus sp. IEGM1428]|uniref:acyltransferase family protein n=1 Tax=Rhodococcus sp. IEGM1428 TaxID=3392191 RepID=UPI003D09B9C6
MMTRVNRHKKSARARRDNTFDFLRLVAASVVVIAHAQTDLGTSPILWNSWELIDGIGMFFIMSGMMVYASGVKTHATTGSWQDYFLNRYLRIAPGIYAFAILLPIILVVTGAMVWKSLFSFDIVVWAGGALALLPNYHPSIWDHVGTGVLNGHLYTIPAEISFYLVVPILVWAAHKWGFKVMLAAMIAISIAGPLAVHFAPGPIPNILHHTFIERAGFFTAGVFFAHYWKRLPQKWWLFAAASSVYLLIKGFGPGYEVYEALQPALLALPLAYAVVFFGNYGPRFLATLTKRIGDLSFGTYIWHVLVVNLFIYWGWVSNAWLVPIVLLITWLIAEVSWRLIEKPALKLKRVSSQDLSRAPVAP